MFVVIQYPFVDSRMLKKDSSDIFFPNLFRKKPTQRCYFRFLGAEKLRVDAEDFPQGEKSYFNSNAVASFLPKSQSPLHKVVFNRFYADDLSFHYDIGLHGYAYSTKIDFFIRELMEIPRLKVTSRFDSRERNFSPYTFFEEILWIYQYATTSKKKIEYHVHRFKLGLYLALQQLLSNTVLMKLNRLQKLDG